MTLEKELVEPSSGGSFERLSLRVRLKPSLGGSRICTSPLYATLMASRAPNGSPAKKAVSGGGVGNETESKTWFGFFVVTYHQKCVYIYILVFESPCLYI